MTRAANRVGLVAGAGVLILALGAAQRPSILSRASPGLWEISGLPGASAPARQCVADLSKLAQYEHRDGDCSRTVIRDAADFAEVHYSCGGRGFGRTTIKLLTPRSLRVETQGISGTAPFHYVLQARRMGECPGH